jgi:predicted O-methyltransferase YrrM
MTHDEVYKEAINLFRSFKPQSMVEEVTFLFDKVLETSKGDVVEIGSASGASTIVLIKAAELVNKNVISVDPYPVELEGVAMHYAEGITSALKEEFKKNILNGNYQNIVQYNEDIKDCINKIPDGLSVVFIDGLHELDNALTEFNLLYPKVMKGGWICFHDTTDVPLWSLGQLSQTPEGGLINIREIIDEQMFQEIKNVGTMLCGRK